MFENERSAEYAAKCLHLYQFERNHKIRCDLLDEVRVRFYQSQSHPHTNVLLYIT